jgi:hypothetical protein
MMSEPVGEITPAHHRQLGVELFNATWTLLDKTARTIAEDDQMIHMAHASRYHWGQVGEPVNLARGEWQISRVYAVVRHPEAALYHARRSLEICQTNGIGDFDLAFAYEALARAFAVSGDPAQRDEYLALARQAGNQIAEKEDRDYFFSSLTDIT